jgi:hypothetical protein
MWMAYKNNALICSTQQYSFWAGLNALRNSVVSLLGRREKTVYSTDRLKRIGPRTALDHSFMFDYLGRTTLGFLVYFFFPFLFSLFPPSFYFFLFSLLSNFVFLFLSSFFSPALSFLFYFHCSIFDFLFLFYACNMDIQGEMLTLSPRKEHPSLSTAWGKVSHNFCMVSVDTWDMK